MSQEAKKNSAKGGKAAARKKKPEQDPDAVVPAVLATDPYMMRPSELAAQAEAARSKLKFFG